MPPVRSLRMSPNRLDPTITSKVCGRRTSSSVAASMCSLSVATSGNSRRQFREHAIPQHVGIALRVRLRDHRQAAPPRARELEREAQDALDAAARVHRRLHRDFVRRARAQDAAVVDVFAFGVLAHDDEIDRLVRTERAGTPGNVRAGRTHA